jgi:hypothetical protein
MDQLPASSPVKHVCVTRCNERSIELQATPDPDLTEMCFENGRQ